MDTFGFTMSFFSHIGKVMLRKHACIFSISLPVGIILLYVARDFDKLTVVQTKNIIRDGGKNAT